MNQGVVEFIKRALRASVYASPKAPGLTLDELYEAGERMGFKRGEIGDGLRYAGVKRYFGVDRMLPDLSITQDADFIMPHEPDERNVHAFQFARHTLNEVAREMGARNASIDRDVLVQRGVAQGMPERDLEAAVTVLVLTELLVEKDGKLTRGVQNYAMPYDQQKQAAEWAGNASHRRQQDDKAVKIIEAVKDIVSRRTDGRESSASALDAFTEAFDKMSFGNFRLWWTQTVRELKQLDPSHTPVAAAVASAALVEGSLTFAAKYARANNLDAFKSKDFDGDPRTWRIDDLVKSANSGGPTAVLDNGTRHHADALIKVRQRIHAGRMLSDFPTGVPDLRPEEAVAAKATAEKVVRCVLDWLAKIPPKT